MTLWHNSVTKKQSKNRENVVWGPQKYCDRKSTKNLLLRFFGIVKDNHVWFSGEWWNSDWKLRFYYADHSMKKTGKQKTRKVIQTCLFARECLYRQLSFNNSVFAIPITQMFSSFTRSAAVRLSDLFFTEKILKDSKFPFNEEMIEVMELCFAEQNKTIFLNF